MPSFTKEATRQSSKRRRKTPPAFPPHNIFDPDDDDQTVGADGGPRTVGRLRRHLASGKGREFDIADPTTPEGRMVAQDSTSFYIPAGDEPHLRRPNSNNTNTGTSVKEISVRDVGRFKVSDFAVRATDERGHSKSVKVTMPDQMVNELAAIVDSRLFPTRSIDALIRTYAYEGILTTHRIAQEHGLFIPNSHVKQLEMLATLNKNIMAVLAYDDLLTANCDGIRDLVRRGARNKARAMVYELLNAVKNMNSRELRDRWQTDIQREFAYLLKGSPAQAHVKRVPTDDSADEDES